MTDKEIDDLLSSDTYGWIERWDRRSLKMLIKDVLEDRKPMTEDEITLLEWAVSRWRDEVENRPLNNKNRRSLDDAWRQVVKFAGGNPEELLGPSHDTLLASSN